MRQLLSLLLCMLLLTGCGSTTPTEPAAVPTEAQKPSYQSSVPTVVPEYTSRFDSVTEIVLSDDGITVDGGSETDAVFTSHDIIYYEDRNTYDSGNPYGEGTDADKHTAREADAHTVVNITAPGAYRISGKLSAGQIRVDLGKKADDDPNAVVELILSGADITCTVAPAILFLNTYECGSNQSADTTQANVDTITAGANLILEGTNTINGAYVARIYKDKDGEKKLWKQDGAIYSYMSMNVFGPGALELTAANEGLNTEMHLSINGGDLLIHSQNDGINSNEDDVSVVTINGGNLTVFAGLGAEGDGIDSNGYLVINGGRVVASAKPISDGGLDSALGTYINGGTVIAMGSDRNWIEEAGQPTMNLQFADPQEPGIFTVAKADGTVVFSIDLAQAGVERSFTGAMLSFPDLTQKTAYTLSMNDAALCHTGPEFYMDDPVTFFSGITTP